MDYVFVQTRISSQTLVLVLRVLIVLTLVPVLLVWTQRGLLKLFTHPSWFIKQKLTDWCFIVLIRHFMCII